MVLELLDHIKTSIKQKKKEPRNLKKKYFLIATDKKAKGGMHLALPGK